MKTKLILSLSIFIGIISLNGYSQCSTTYPAQGTCSGCTSNPSGSITLSTANQTVCYSGTGTINTLTINANNVTVLICGSGSNITITSISGYGSGVTVLINAGNNLTITNAPYFLYGVGTVVNYGTFNTSASWTLSTGANLINASSSAIMNFNSSATLTTSGGIILMNGGTLNVPGTLKFSSNNTACFNNNAIINVGTLNVATSGPAVAVSSGNSSCISITTKYTSSNDPIVANSSPGTLNVCAQGSSLNYPASGSASWGGANVTLNCNTQCNLILPVTLGNFSLNYSGTKVVLNWTTYSEENSKSFEIQRSNNGFSFATIGTVNSSNNTSSQTDYNFIDFSPSAGTNFYRLKVNDINGNYSYSPVQQIDIAPPSSMKVIVNKSQNNIQVIMPKGAENSTVRLLDMMGRILKTVSSNGSQQSITIEASYLHSGIYIIELISPQVHQSKQFYFSAD